MKRLLLLLTAIALLLWSSIALAQTPTPSPTPRPVAMSVAAPNGSIATTWDQNITWTFNPASAPWSATQDISKCDTLTRTFDADVGGSEQVAEYEIYSCPTSGADEPECVKEQLTYGEHSEVEFDPRYPYIRLRKVTDPGANNYAKVTIGCTTNTYARDNTNASWQDRDMEGNTVKIDVTGQSDPCEYAMSKMIDVLIDSDADCSGTGECVGYPPAWPTHFELSGLLEATQDEMADYTDYAVCLQLCGSNATKTGEPSYPEPYAGGTGDGDSFNYDFDGRALFSFDNLQMNIDQTGSTKRLVPLKMGCAYDVGWENTGTSTDPGNRLSGIVMEGNLAITFSGAVEGDDGGGNWNAGHVPTVNVNEDTLGGTDHNSATSSVAIWEDGLMRSDLTRFNPWLQGASADDDDFGYLIGTSAWLVDRGRIVALGFGVGMNVHGNTIGILADGGNLETNEVNFLAGDIYTGDCMDVSDTAIKGASYRDLRCNPPDGFSLNNFTIEGAAPAGLVIASGRHITFQHGHFELPSAGTQEGHLIIIGGGWSASSYLPCALANDVGSEACTAATGGTIVFQNIRFTGASNITGDRYGDDWDGIIFGENFGSAGSDRVTLGGYMDLNDIDKTTNDGSPACTDAEVDCRLFNAHASATGVVDITNVWSNDNLVAPTDYPAVRHAGMMTLFVKHRETAPNDQEAVSFGGDVADFDTTEGVMEIPTPGGHDNSSMGDYWALHSFGAQNVAAATTDGCCFSVREGDRGVGAADSSFDGAGFVAGALGGNYFCIGDECGGSSLCDLEADGDQILLPTNETISVDKQIVMRTDNHDEIASSLDLCNSGTLESRFWLNLIPRIDR